MKKKARVEIKESAPLCGSGAIDLRLQANIVTANLLVASCGNTGHWACVADQCDFRLKAKEVSGVF